jgi:hypothetical protein
VGKQEMCTELLSGNMNQRQNLEDLDTDRRIILKCKLQKYDVRVKTALIWLRIRRSGRCCEHSNKTSSTINAGTLLFLKNKLPMELYTQSVSLSV